jgi:class 3 adenylate cyclase
MKRKIAAIMAADIAGYSRLVAEDEEETLRRLASYRAVFEDFVGRFSGRIFNTAGDAVLAEFSSAVEAVRCAIDVQESIRTRNLAYPISRQMCFRIGITIGDIVERDGDLLGDGVNIAARLEGLAQPGGLCVSRTVYEQVSNKLSVEFVDIGEQSVKNIPTPIHAYVLPLGSEGSRAPKPPPTRSTAKSAVRRSVVWPAAVIAASLAVIVASGTRYQATSRADTPGVTQAAAVTAQAARPATTPAARPAATQGDAQALPGRDAALDRQASAVDSDNASWRDLKSPCTQIRLACEQAGFVLGAVRDGGGLQVDCILPIMRARPQPPAANKPLPQIDPQVVEACRAKNARFGETLPQLFGSVQPAMERPFGRMRP